MVANKIFIHHFAVMAPAEIIESTMHFYRDVLGITPGFRPEFSLPGYWLYSGGEPIIHLTVKDDREQSGNRYFHHIALRCSNFEDVTDRLSKSKTEYRQLDANNAGQIQLTLFDPAGNLVELNFEAQSNV